MKLEKQISEKEEDIKVKLVEADRISRDFIKETSDFIQGEYAKIAKSIGLSQSEVSQKMGKTGIERLMRSIDDLKNETDNICQRNLFKSSAWRHLSWDEADRYSEHHKRASHYISGELRDFQILGHHFYDCLGPFGDLLYRVGFATGQKREGYGAYALQESVPHPDVARLFIWTDGMKSLASSYKIAERELSILDKELKDLKVIKAKEDSQDLWSAF